ncbi:unnamed protein product [Arabis nemorensis]|uniref:COBRA-like protein n=1 Tax=Arabis nemorensis TaxID=586526 RepID=A0A565CJH0_9BRAS|nr:unnamed protein product [Arabis nemorensis]
MTKKIGRFLIRDGHWDGDGLKTKWILNIFGAETTEKGDCSRFKQNIPHSCVRNPRVVDLLPGVPFNQKIANCCKGGVLDSESATAFQISVGNAGTTVMMPKQQYVCGPTRKVNAIVLCHLTWYVSCVFYKETSMSS